MRQDTLPGRVHGLALTFAKFIGLVLAFTLLGVGTSPSSSAWTPSPSPPPGKPATGPSKCC